MKKLISLVVAILICTLNLSCKMGAPGRSADNKFLYSKEDIVGIEIVLVGERLGKEYLDFPNLTTIVVIDNLDSCIEDFSNISASNAFDRFYEVKEGEIAIKINYANGCWQIFTPYHTAETIYAKELQKEYDQLDSFIRDQYDNVDFGDYEGLCYRTPASSIVHDNEEFFDFLVKYVEMYGGDVQIVLDKMAEYNN